MPANQSDVAGDPERFVCPNGHRTWERTADHFWCYDCSQLYDADPEFDELVDPGTGDTVSATRVSAS